MHYRHYCLHCTIGIAKYINVRAFKRYGAYTLTFPPTPCHVPQYNHAAAPLYHLAMYRHTTIPPYRCTSLPCNAIPPSHHRTVVPARHVPPYHHVMYRHTTIPPYRCTSLPCTTIPPCHHTVVPPCHVPPYHHATIPTTLLFLLLLYTLCVIHYRLLVYIYRCTVQTIGVLYRLFVYIITVYRSGSS